MGIVGVEPALMGMGPAPATRRVLAQAGLSLADIDLIEINEAFAGAVPRRRKGARARSRQVNVNGGAIALGHPLGASGTRLLLTLLLELRRRGKKRGLATRVHRRRPGHRGGGGDDFVRYQAAEELTMAIKNCRCAGVRADGSGIAQVCAAAGYKTIVREVEQGFLDKGMARVRKFLDDGVTKGKVTAEARDTTLGNLSGHDDVRRRWRTATSSSRRSSRTSTRSAKTYAALEHVVGADTIFLSNTSSLCITELAAATRRPDRFGGLHFFNPVPLMKLVEVIRALTTSDETYQTVFAFAQSLGKEPITAPDRPGFIVNRLLVPYLLDAIRAYENGLGTLEDIDKGMKLGCGYPMGPFTLLDFVGLDTTYYIANIMFEEFREPAYAPPPLLKRMVLAGRMGRKSGHGFYKYEG